MNQPFQMILRMTMSKNYIVPFTLEEDASLVRQEFVDKSENFRELLLIHTLL